MNKTHYILLIFLGFSNITGCATTSPLTPSQTAQQFWSAVLERNLETAQGYVTTDTGGDLADANLDLSEATVVFGNVKLSDGRAKIATIITFPDESEDKSTSNDKDRNTENSVRNAIRNNTAFNTYIEKENSAWKVDFAHTRKSIDKANEKRRLGDIVDDLHKYGNEFSGSLDELMKKWSQASPEIRKDLETLGEATKDEVEDAIKHLAPELKNSIRDFSDSITEALKQLKPKEPDELEQKKSPKPKLI